MLGHRTLIKLSSRWQISEKRQPVLHCALNMLGICSIRHRVDHGALADRYFPGVSNEKVRDARSTRESS